MSKLLGISVILLCMIGCGGGTTTPNTQSETTTNGGAVGSIGVVALATGVELQAQSFGDYSGPFSGRTPAPAISTYRQDPVSALGSIFARVAKTGKKCDSANGSDFDYKRLVEQRPDKCKTQSHPPADVAHMLIDAKTATKLEYVFGSVAATADFAFELTVSEPVTAVLQNTSDCLEPAVISSLLIPEQTCDLQYVAGVVVTQISYRQFKKLTGNANAEYLVKVGLDVYGASSQLTNKWYMTVDSLDLTRFFARNPTSAFLEKKIGAVAISKNTVEKTLGSTETAELKTAREKSGSLLLDKLMKDKAVDFAFKREEAVDVRNQ